MTRFGIVITLVVVLAFASAAPAIAGGPPVGKYGCTIGSGYAGDLKILSGHRYRVNRSRIGRFRVLGGHRLKFTSGTWKGLFGKARWYRSNTGIVEIAMTPAGSNFENTYCDKES